MFLLCSQLEYIDVGTPVSNKHYLGQPEGEMYGLEHNIRRYEPDISMQLRAHSGIPGLYLTGELIFLLDYLVLKIQKLKRNFWSVCFQVFIVVDLESFAPNHCGFISHQGLCNLVIM